VCFVIAEWPSWLEAISQRQRERSVGLSPTGRRPAVVVQIFFDRGHESSGEAETDTVLRANEHLVVAAHTEVAVVEMKELRAIGD
jgi:hypothetical protein